MRDERSQEQIAAMLRARARRYAAPLQTAVAEGEPYVGFERGGVRYLVALGGLAEIRAAERLTRIPGVAEAIAGVVHLRGRIVTVHDLAWRSRRGPPPDEGWLLVCAGGLDHMALLADAVDDIRYVDPQSLRPPPVTLSLPPSCATAIDADAAIVLDLEGLRREPAFFRA